ncbi:MAG TPA: amidohydrolase family protein [Acidimicrobiales bacterium]
MTTIFDGMPLISADSHVTEPIDLYAERLPASMRHRAPTIHNQGDWRILEAEGMAIRKLMSASELDLAVVGGSSSEQRFREQEQDGVVAEVVFPNWALQVCFVPEDPELQKGLARAYNDWAAETMLGEERILPVGLVSMLDIDAAVKEAERLAGLGFRALFLPARVPSRPYNDAAYDPFWATAQEIGLPLTFHSGTGYDPRIVRGPGAAVINYVLGAQSDGPSVFLHLAAGGALDRFPGLRIVAVETCAAWMAWVMTQADLVYEDHKMFRTTSLTMKPSELIRRQCHATFMTDTVAVHNRSITGVEPLLWGNDYPHPEGTWPHSVEAVHDQFAELTREDVFAMVAGNAARVFGFDISSLPVLASA